MPSGSEPAHRWVDLGSLPYASGIDLQRRIAVDRVADRRPDTLLLVEHPPTITLGRRASERDLRWSEEQIRQRGLDLVRVARGGAATYHGPGQLVGYPILRIARHGRRVRPYVAGLEEMLCAVAARFGVRAHRDPAHTGVWVGEAKLASIGIEIHRGVSQHGFALNVDMDLAPFAAIVPCGQPDLRLTDLSRASGRRIAMADARAAVLEAWTDRFGPIEEDTTEWIRPTS